MALVQILSHSHMYSEPFLGRLVTWNASESHSTSEPLSSIAVDPSSGSAEVKTSRLFATGW